MKTRNAGPRNTKTGDVKEKPEKQSESPAAGSAPSPANTREITPKDVRRMQLSYLEKSDGTLAVDNMRDGSKIQIREFFQRPDVQKMLDLPKDDGEAKPKAGKHLVEQAFRLIGQIKAFAVSRAVKALSKEQIDSIMLYDPEEMELLVPVTVRFLEKRGPDWLREWNEDVEFFVVFLSVEIGKFAKLRTLINRQERLQNSNVPRPAPTLLTPERPAPMDNPPATAPPETEAKSPVENDIEALDNAGLEASPA